MRIDSLASLRELALRGLTDSQRAAEQWQALLDSIDAGCVPLSDSPEQPNDPVDQAAHQFRQRCQELGIHIIDNSWVREADAARLINRSPDTMRNWRQNGEDKIPYKKITNRTCYSLYDLARYKVERSARQR